MTRIGKAEPESWNADHATEAVCATYLERGLRLVADAVYHTHDSRRSAAGFPDYTIVVGPWLLFVELKRWRGEHTLTHEQAVWLSELTGPARRSYCVAGQLAVSDFVELAAGMKNGRDPLLYSVAAPVLLGELVPRGRRIASLAGFLDASGRPLALDVAGSPTP